MLRRCWCARDDPLAQEPTGRACLALTRRAVRDAIAPGLRAIPAAGRGVIVFMVDDAARLVLVKAIGYAGSDWVGRARRR